MMARAMRLVCPCCSSVCCQASSPSSAMRVHLRVVHIIRMLQMDPCGLGWCCDCGVACFRCCSRVSQQPSTLNQNGRGSQQPGQVYSPHALCPCKPTVSIYRSPQPFHETCYKKFTQLPGCFIWSRVETAVVVVLRMANGAFFRLHLCWRGQCAWCVPAALLYAARVTCSSQHHAGPSGSSFSGCSSWTLVALDGAATVVWRVLLLLNC
jgi:hypothetical protein